MKPEFQRMVWKWDDDLCCVCECVFGCALKREYCMWVVTVCEVERERERERERVKVWGDGV